MYTLGIESSCDETAAAVLRDHDLVVANVIDSQIEVHGRYGGVVPELASRKHLENIWPVVTEALTRSNISLSAIDLVAVTQGPGLIGSLLVGLSFAKALSHVSRIPYIGVDHMAGHLAAIALAPSVPVYPMIALVVSGGHSNIYRLDSATDYTLLGRTRDDAAGEAFDKVAKLLGLPYPGGPRISDLARLGDPHAFAYPRAWLDQESLDFSFSGLKTAVANHVMSIRRCGEKLPVHDICASFQEAVVDVLVGKTIAAAHRHGLAAIGVAGGVAANPRLREKLDHTARQAGFSCTIPAPIYCTDNAAMIALAGYVRRHQAGFDLTADVYSRQQTV